LILNRTARVYPDRLPQKYTISLEQVQRRGNAATLAKNRPNGRAGGDQQKAMRRGSRFQVVPHSRTPPEVCCKNGALQRSRTRRI
jgi:hypothetical protein